MKTIRQRVFETNSSSTHSICIVEECELNDTIQKDSNGDIELEGGEFGWEEASYRDALTKANYMAQYVDGWCGDKKEEFTSILIEVIRKQTGCRDVIFGNLDSGYIDHQSVEDQQYHDLFEDPELLRKFIFSKQNILHTDNDNH